MTSGSESTGPGAVAQAETDQPRTFALDSFSRVITRHFDLTLRGWGAQADFVIDRVHRNRLDLDLKVAPKGLRHGQIKVDQGGGIVDGKARSVSDGFHMLVLLRLKVASIWPTREGISRMERAMASGERSLRSRVHPVSRRRARVGPDKCMPLAPCSCPFVGVYRRHMAQRSGRDRHCLSESLCIGFQ